MQGISSSPMFAPPPPVTLPKAPASLPSNLQTTLAAAAQTSPSFVPSAGSPLSRNSDLGRRLAAEREPSAPIRQMNVRPQEPARSDPTSGPQARTLGQKFKNLFSCFKTPEARSGFAGSTAAFTNVSWGRRALDSLQSAGEKVGNAWKSLCDGVTDMMSVGSTAEDTRYGSAWDPATRREYQGRLESQRRGGSGTPLPPTF